MHQYRQDLPLSSAIFSARKLKDFKIFLEQIEGNWGIPRDKLSCLVLVLLFLFRLKWSLCPAGRARNIRKLIKFCSHIVLISDCQLLGETPDNFQWSYFNRKKRRNNPILLHIMLAAVTVLLKIITRFSGNLTWSLKKTDNETLSQPLSSVL